MYLGEFNQLVIDRFREPGAYLRDAVGNEVLLPGKYVEPELKEGDTVNVFVYKDSEDRMVAVTDQPKIELYSFAFLLCKDVNHIGAFMDWGMEKDLLVPYKEQANKLVEGRSYIIYLGLDDATQRLYGSSKYEHFLEKEHIVVEEGEEVDLLVADFTELGCKVIINNTYGGLIFKNQLYRELSIGERTKGFIKQIRPDGKIDVVLEKQGYQKVSDSNEIILAYLKNNGGKSTITEHSSPEDIKKAFGMSKKTFKKAIGSLYKQRLISLSENEICLL